MRIIPALSCLVLLFACGEKKSGDAVPAAPATPAPTAAPGAPAAGGERGDRDVKPAPADPSGAQMALIVDGAPKGRITSQELAKVKSITVEGDSGEESRSAWSARDVAATLVGPGARVTQVKGENGLAVALDEAAWKDAAKVPVLRVNRRGLLKFFWTSADGTPLPQGDVRGVVELHVASK